MSAVRQIFYLRDHGNLWSAGQCCLRRFLDVKVVARDMIERVNIARFDSRRYSMKCGLCLRRRSVGSILNNFVAKPRRPLFQLKKKHATDRWNRKTFAKYTDLFAVGAD